MVSEEGVVPPALPTARGRGLAEREESPSICLSAGIAEGANEGGTPPPPPPPPPSSPMTHVCREGARAGGARAASPWSSAVATRMPIRR